MQEQAQRAAAVRGWCPTAWRPMMAGDGLLVRLRPPLGRMSRAQAEGLCAGALRHGNGHIDLTNRAALQIRGVGADEHDALMERLVALGLARRNGDMPAPLIVNPDWAPGDATDSIASELIARADELPDMPGKIGFAVDAGSAPVLTDVPADFRIERGMSGGLILHCDGRDRGVPVKVSEAVSEIIAIAHWFMASGGASAGRMARHGAPLPITPSEAPAPPRSRADCLAAASGRYQAVPFGRIEAETLLTAMDDETHAIRLTPWRGLIVEGSNAPSDDPADPRLSVDACPGAPACPQASVATRDLAARLAPHVAGLHISGCAKGCARPKQAAAVLTGRDGRFDLARDARAGGQPERTDLSPTQILALFGAE